MRLANLIFLTPILLAPSCVSSGTYDKAVADGVACGKRATTAEEALAILQADLDRATVDSAARDARLSASLDDSTVLNEQLRKELEKLGKNVDVLLADKGALSLRLVDARARLALLRRAQDAAESRAALYEQLLRKLQKMIDAGELQVALRDGRMVLQLPNDVLFDSGQKELKPRGKESIATIGAVLRTIEGRHFQIAGHTDDEPIKRSPYASNWALSTARGLEVVEFLVQSGVKPQVLSAAGYGEFDPIAANDSAASRAHNRRIEITRVPQVEEMVAVPLP